MSGSSASKSSIPQQQDQQIGETPQSDRDLKLISWDLYPSYLEVSVTGQNLPTRIWARLGAQEVRLLKRPSPKLARPGTREVQEARFASVLEPPVPGVTFSRSGIASDAAGTYELRRGDHKGRLLLGLPDTIVCHHADLVVPSTPRTQADRLKREVRFLSLRLYPGYLEVVVAGQSLPRRLWARLGAQEVPLWRRRSSELVDSGTVDLQEARYARILEAPLAEGTFSLSEKASDAGATYELRRGDHKGRLVLDLPKTIACRHEDPIVSSTLHISAGRLGGWAFDAANPGRDLAVELFELRSCDIPPAAQIPPLGKARFIDLHNSQAPRGTEFTLALPTSLLDGATHELQLTASNGESRQLLWRDTFRASPEWIEAQIRSCSSVAELRRFLTTLAEAGRFEGLARYFTNPSACSDLPISAEEAFQILVDTVLIGGRGDAFNHLHQKFRSFMEVLLAEDVSRRILLKTAISFLNSKSHDASPRRFPHAPLVEALIDFVFVLEDTSDTTLLRELISFCAQSQRYVLARELAERWVRLDKSATALVTAASIELATGNVETAEQLVDQAMVLKPNFNDALLLLARIHARQGRPLHAAAACSGGRGLSRWLQSPPRIEDQRLFAPLDWPGLNAETARHRSRAALLEHFHYADDLYGNTERPSAGGFSIVFLGNTRWDISALSEALRGAGCVQIINQHCGTVSEVESIGRWALIFCDCLAEYLTADFVEAVFAQKRPFEPMVKLVSAILDDTGKPEDFLLRGALVRADLLPCFGPVSLEGFVDRAMAAVRVKTLLI